MAPNALLSQPPIKKVVAIAPEGEDISKEFEQEKGFSLHPCNKRQGQPCIYAHFLTVFPINTTTSQSY